MRKRIDKQNAITDFAQIDDSLKQIALNDAFIEEQTALMNQQLISVKEQYEPAIVKAQNEVESLEKSIEKFLYKNKSLFEKVRSKVLTFGRVGFQAGKKHLGKSKDATWATITENIFKYLGDKYVKVKLTLKKDSVIEALDKGDLTIKDIEAFGAIIIQKDRSFYKVFKNKINSK